MRKSTAALIDLKLLIPALILCGMSLVTLSSISMSLFKSQLIFLVLSLVVYFLATQVNIFAVTRYVLFIYLSAIVLLGLVLFLGFESHGAVRWIGAGVVHIQFAEFFKPVLALCLAFFLSLYTRRSLKLFFGSLLLLLPIIGLIILQPDLGSALIYLFAALFLLVIFGFPWYMFVSAFLAFVVAIPVLWQFLHDYQRQRILSFIHPSHDPLGTSYNAIQSVIAVGSGMFAGRGLGQGTQSTLKFLPERHTDFIFATLAEGLGFLGVIIVLVALFFLLWRMYVLFLELNNPFVKNFVVASFGLILIQAFINIGMNIGMLPVVGVPLPFVSYGGSSLLANFLLLGLISAVSATDKAI